MPMYEFDCQDCQQPFEKRISYTAIDEVVCPTCGGAHVKKKLSLFASQVKGSRPVRTTSLSSCPPGGT